MVRKHTIWTAVLLTITVILSLLTFLQINRYNESKYLLSQQEAFENISANLETRIRIHDHFLISLYAFYNASEHISSDEIIKFYQSWAGDLDEHKNGSVLYYGWISDRTPKNNFLFASDGSRFQLDKEKEDSFKIAHLEKEIDGSDKKIIVAIKLDPFIQSINNTIQSYNTDFVVSKLDDHDHGNHSLQKLYTIGEEELELWYDIGEWSAFGSENYNAFLAALTVFLSITYITQAFIRSLKTADDYKVENDIILKELDEKNYFLNEMVENLPGIVFVKDVQKDYSYHIINKAAAEFFGYPQEEMIGKSDEDYFKPEEVNFFRRIDEAVMKGGHSLDIPCESITTRDGEMLCHTRKVPIYDQEGKPKFLIGLAEDITKRKKNEMELAEYRDNLERMVDERTERLKQAMAKAEESNQLKSEFLATMSHEIRSPMSGVLGMAELLLDTPMTPEQKSLTKTILNSGEILMNIIEDILDFSKIEANKLDLDPVPVNMLEIVDDIGLLYSSKARDKALELAIRYIPGTEQFVYADPVRIRQVLGNLVNNAIKFTEKGHITIVVSQDDTVHKIDDNYVTLRFSIEDSGIGIEEENKEKIFGKFSQANSSTTRQYGGTGLGLSICKKLVELMGGTISFESEVGKGSVFEVAIPMRRNREEYTEFCCPPVLKNIRVLIVDDLEIVQTTLSEQLEHAGMICTVAQNGQQALELLSHAALEKTPFDIAIVDYLMPDMNGEALATAVKSQSSLQDTCLIMLTAAGTPIPANQNGNSNFSAFMSKPIRAIQLIETLSYVWEKYSQGSKNSIIRIDNQTLQTSYNNDRDYQVEGARILLVEDSRLNQAFAEEVLHQIHCDVTIAANGQEALELLKTSTFDLVLMDCQMPVMDGFEASKNILRMKEDGTVPQSMPVIALTANAMKGDRQKCLEAGMNDYISKPVRKQELKDKIHQWIVVNKDYLESASSLATKTEKPVLDQNAYQEARSIMKDKFDSLMTSYVEDVESYIREMHDAISKNDIGAMVRTAHTIKSTSKRIGAFQLSEIAAAIEAFAKDVSNNNHTAQEVEDDLMELSEAFERTREALFVGKAG